MLPGRDDLVPSILYWIFPEEEDFVLAPCIFVDRALTGAYLQ